MKMKVKVVRTFRDKNDHVTLYAQGMILDVKSEGRAQSLLDRGLCKEFKGRQRAASVLE